MSQDEEQLSGVQLLGVRHAITILLYIDRCGTVKEVDVRNDITGSYDMARSRLIMLESSGLLVSEYPDARVRGYKARMWSITDRGRAVASLVIRAGWIIDGVVDLESTDVCRGLRAVGDIRPNVCRVPETDVSRTGRRPWFIRLRISV